ncbi:MAG: hypothetical protein V5A57_02695 [Candidatus Paceibacterota bacterium]
MAVVSFKFDCGGEHQDECCIDGEERIAKCENSNGIEPRYITDKKSIRGMLIGKLYRHLRTIKGGD